MIIYIYIDADEKVYVYRTLENRIDEVDLEEYVCSVVANEMQVNFENEAIKQKEKAMKKY